MKKRKPQPRTSQQSFFVNKQVADQYELRPCQGDTHLIIPKLNWRGQLSRITPTVAAYLVQHGTNLFARKPQPNELV